MGEGRVDYVDCTCYDDDRFITGMCNAILTYNATSKRSRHL